MSRRGTTYGQKGGEGPTRGRKASVYLAALPNGLAVTVKSFKTHVEHAVVAWYTHEGVFYPNGAWDPNDLPDWVVESKRTPVPAMRIVEGH